MAKPKRLFDHTEEPSRRDNIRRFPQANLERGGDLPPAVRALVQRIVQHYVRGEGFAHCNLVPLPTLPENRQQYPRAFLDQARLLDLITKVVRAMSDAKAGEPNPTLGVLDFLIAERVISDLDLIAMVLESDALLVGHEGYVMGLGWTRFGIVRTEARAPLFQPPAVHTAESVPIPYLTPGIYEHGWLYCRREPGEHLGLVPTHFIDVPAACGMTGWESKTLYSKLSGNRRDWRLDAARWRAADSSREVKFKPREFWRYLFERR